MKEKPKTEATVETAEGKEQRSPLLSAARRVLLAGVGAIALAQDEIEDFVNKLVERGEIAEQDGKKLIGEVIERRKQVLEKKEGEFARRIEGVLERMKVPTKADLEALSDRIAALSKKIDEMKKNQ